MRQAVIERIRHHEPDEQAQILKLILLAREEQAMVIADKLIKLYNHSHDQHIPKDTDPEIMIYAFLKVAELEPWVI